MLPPIRPGRTPSSRPMLAFAAAALLIRLGTTPISAADDASVRWLLEHRGKAVPSESDGWTHRGAGGAEIEDDVLHLTDDSAEPNYYEATWNAEPNSEIIVEARVKVGRVSGSVKNKPASSLWPWRDGAPVAVHVSDGVHEEGLVLSQTQAASFTDRFVPMDTTSRFHTYRLEIRGTDMAMYVDGVKRVDGQNAFSHPATSKTPFIRFGSTAKNATGDAYWDEVKLGIRRPTEAPALPPVAIKASEAWEIKRTDARQTRPYLYEMGGGLLLVSVAQGPDAFYEPYGVLKSTDEGRTWTPIQGLDLIDYAPLPLVRRPDGSILGASRWTWSQPDGSLTGITTHLNENATAFTTEESRITLPAKYMPSKPSDVVIFERHIWNDDDGGITAVCWSRIGVPRADGRMETQRFSHLVRSMDNGKTWTHVSVIGPGGEPAVARVSKTELTAVIRGARTSQMTQVFSHDGGRTWDQPIALEVGKVAPDLVLMSNGVLACSYGRPASCLMLSTDGGKTWPAHYVISDRVGFNYSSIREISPGRLLYMHDAPSLRALHVDVKLNR